MGEGAVQAEGVVSGSDQGPRPRRPRWFILGIVVVLIAVSPLIIKLFLDAYQPLQHGVLGGFPGSSVATSSDLTVKEVEYEHAGAYEYRFGLSNGGRLGVTVLEISGAPFVLDEEIRLGSVDLQGGPLPWDKSEPFREFALTGGTLREIVVRGAFWNCQSRTGGSEVVFDSVRVRYRLLGFEREMRVPLDGTAVIFRDGGESFDFSYMPNGPRGGCPVLQPRGGVAAFIDLEPRPRAAVWNRYEGATRRCAIDVTGATGRTYRGRLEGVAGGEVGYVELSTFDVPDGKPWRLEEDPPARMEVSCADDPESDLSFAGEFDVDRIRDYLAQRSDG